MKALLPLLLTLILFSFTKQSLASHYMGGEITWRCIPSGQPNAGKFIFTMKVYRECGGIAFGTTQTLASTSPAGSIPMTLKTGWPKDLSPTCNIGGFSSTGISQITCASASMTNTSNTGAVSEYIYESAPLHLSGIPPTSGWTFHWGVCCRNPSTNVYGQPGWKLRAKMYSINSQNTYPCFDNSPTFANKIQTALNVGVSNTVLYLAFDKEMDSLTYEWGQPLITLTQPLTYNSGYSHTNPLPDTSENINNIAATIDPSNGMMSFTSFTSGSFVTSVKISAFKNGQLTAELWREIQVILRHDTNTNSRPNITPPLKNFTAFTDTFYVGDTISFPINIQDAQFLPNGSTQTVYFQAYSNQFGNYIPSYTGSQATYSATTGCVKPPCATLTPAPSETLPVSAPLGVSSYFNWKTSINNLEVSSSGTYKQTSYSFIISSKDDYCPVPASINKLITIVLKPRFLDVPDIKTVNIDNNGIVKLEWNPIINTKNLFLSYQIYSSDSLNGTYTLVDNITDHNVGSYTYNAGASPQIKKYYYLAIKHDMAPYNPIINSKTVGNIVIKNQRLSPCVTKLEWNPLFAGDTSYYRVYRKTNTYNWTLIHLTNNLNYTDSADNTRTKYKVLNENINLVDSLGNNYTTYSQSGIINVSSEVNIGNDTTICNNQYFFLYSNQIFSSYLWSTGNTQNVILVDSNAFGLGTHNVWLKASMNYGCQSTDTMVLVMENCTSIADNNNNKYSFNVFPNPNEGIFNIKMNSKTNESIEIEVIDIVGKTVFYKKYKNSNSIRLDISNQAAGTYILKLKGKYGVYQKTITIK